MPHSLRSRRSTRRRRLLFVISDPLRKSPAARPGRRRMAHRAPPQCQLRRQGPPALRRPAPTHLKSQGVGRSVKSVKTPATDDFSPQHLSTTLPHSGERGECRARSVPRAQRAVEDRDRRHAAQRIAAIGGAGGHDFRAGWRDDGRDPLSVPSPPPAGRRGSREPEPVDNALGRAAAGLAVGQLAATPRPRPRRRLARPAAPQPPPPAPNVRPPRPEGQAPTFGVTGLAARPRSPSSGTTPHRPAAVAAVAMAAAPSVPGRRNHPSDRQQIAPVRADPFRFRAGRFGSPGDQLAGTRRSSARPATPVFPGAAG